MDRLQLELSLEEVLEDGELLVQELKLLELLEEQLIELDEEWLHDELDEQDNEEEDETELEQLKKETVTDNPNFMFK